MPAAPFLKLMLPLTWKTRIRICLHAYRTPTPPRKSSASAPRKAHHPQDHPSSAQQAVERMQPRAQAWVKRKRETAPQGRKKITGAWDGHHLPLPIVRLPLNSTASWSKRVHSILSVHVCERWRRPTEDKQPPFLGIVGIAQTPRLCTSDPNYVDPQGLPSGKSQSSAAEPLDPPTGGIESQKANIQLPARTAHHSTQPPTRKAAKQCRLNAGV